MKKYVIYAGVNGAGKSTFYNTRAEYDMPRVNSDEIVKELGDWKNNDKLSILPNKRKLLSKVKGTTYD